MAAASLVHRVLSLSSLLVLLCLVSCTPSSNGVNANTVELKTEKGITYINGKPYTGTVYFTEERDTVAIQVYKAGKADGTWQQFYRNKQVQEIRYFENGKKEGVYQSWWENGKPKAVYTFEADEYEGMCEEWLENGQLISKKNYHRGQEAGLQQMWTRDGKLWANYEARNGRQYGILGTKGCATLWNKDSVVAH